MFKTENYELTEQKKPYETDQLIKENEDKLWKEKTQNEKIFYVVFLVVKIFLLITCLYVFIISLELMTSSFRLIAGAKATEIFDPEIINNPLAGLMIGVLVTVIVQSSSTSSSIIVSMVAASIIEVKPAIPIIMGANIGTSVTSTLVAFAQVTNKERFRLSFAGATVHDMFNILSVLILLPIEITTGYLRETSGLILGNSNSSSIENVEFLKVITEPLTKLIVQLDTKVLDEIAKNSSCCGETPRLLKHNFTCKDDNKTSIKCEYLFESINLPEYGIGLIILFASLICLCFCLVGMVKILSSLFKGSIANMLQKMINSDLPGPFKYLTGYLAIIIGCALTILVQSSSVFTSSLIPLVGLGLVKLERIFPLTLGSNIGTTITGILAALASGSEGEQFRYSLQIALCHTIFNITGILIWYPLPFTRKIPLLLAKKLGEISADYRWFALVYLFGMFFVLPLFIFGLSQAGDIAFWCVLGPIIIIIALVVIINVLQEKLPIVLPEFLKTWNFLPLALRSLKPYDRILRKTICRCKRFDKIEAMENESKLPDILIEKF